MADKTVTIYLRSVIKDKRHCLAMFDTNGKGDINNLETVVEPGSTIIWKLDLDCRIEKLINISSREGKSRIFINNLIKKSEKEIVLQLPPDLYLAFEAYNIEYIDDDSKTRVIDPYIRIEPPSTNPKTID